MATARNRDQIFPHISSRSVAGRSEPFIPGTGLAVWEVVWLSHVYRGNVEALTHHLDIAPTLIEGALEYARIYPDEIERTVQVIEVDSIDRLREKLPGIRVVSVGSEQDGKPRT